MRIYAQLETNEKTDSLSKETEDVKKNQTVISELKNTVIEDGLNNHIEGTEERTTELTATEITQSEQQRENRQKKIYEPSGTYGTKIKTNETF